MGNYISKLFSWDKYYKFSPINMQKNVKTHTGFVYGGTNTKGGLKRTTMKKKMLNNRGRSRGRG